MDIYYGKWTDISGIIEYILQTNLILDLNSFVNGPSGAKGLIVQLGSANPSNCSSSCMLIVNLTHCVLCELMHKVENITGEPLFYGHPWDHAKCPN